MRIVASIPDPADIEPAISSSPDLIEFRIDLMPQEPEIICDAMRRSPVPIIVTLRSIEEGGQFAGTPREWRDAISPYLPLAEYIDIERRFRSEARSITGRERTIIASCHLPDMPGSDDLEVLAGDLRRFGDIPKIVVMPADHRDVITLLRFTMESPAPIATGVMGEDWRWVRAVLPFFGSHLVYCHAGRRTAPGQFSVDEFRRLRELMKG
ncbi:MAG: type I 3-dehydroquinate dehydratase [Methanoculleaceae archaeon]